MTLKSLIKQSLEHLDRADPRSALYFTEKAKSQSPKNYKALFLNGLTLLLLGRFSEAMNDLQTALSMSPEDPDIHTYLGRCFMALRDNKNALNHFRESGRLKAQSANISDSNLSIPRFRFKHDLEQLEALKQKRGLNEINSASLSAFQNLWGQLGEVTVSENITIPVSSPWFESISHFYNNHVHSEPGSTIASGALNSDLDSKDLSNTYLASGLQVLVIDNFLSAKALKEMRNHCHYSTMWSRDMANGYLATTLEDNFACPLVFQIADELRDLLPEVMQDHRLSYAWAFKYDSTLKGVPVHADDAAINVNFWITDGESNRSPETGGIIIWNKKAPAEWDFEAYNAMDSVERIREYLQNENAEGVRIPHQANRAVIFDSDLLHETDHIDFKDDYMARRINITYLYGVCRAAR